MAVPSLWRLGTRGQAGLEVEALGGVRVLALRSVWPALTPHRRQAVELSYLDTVGCRVAWQLEVLYCTAGHDV